MDDGAERNVRSKTSGVKRSGGSGRTKKMTQRTFPYYIILFSPSSPLSDYNVFTQKQRSQFTPISVVRSVRGLSRP